MSKRNINVKSISDIRVRRDGKEVVLTFNGANEQSVTVTLQIEDLGTVMQALLRITTVARLNNGLPPDTQPTASPTSFDPVPQVFFVEDFEGVTYERSGSLGGGLDLRLHNRKQGVIQIGFLPEHAKRLFDILLETQSSDDDQAAH